MPVAKSGTSVSELGIIALFEAIATVPAFVKP